MTARIALAIGVTLACTSAQAALARIAEPLERVAVAVNPHIVCTTGRAGQYPNLDLVIENKSSRDRQIEEIRALVRDRSGMLLERRMLWQQGLELLGPHRTIRGRSTTSLFNPFAFSNDLTGKDAHLRTAADGRSGSRFRHDEP